MSPVPVPEANPGSWTRGYDLGVKMGSDVALYRAGVLIIPDELLAHLEGDLLDEWSKFAGRIVTSLAPGPGPEVVHVPENEIAQFSAGFQSGLGRGRALAATKRATYTRPIRVDARDLQAGDVLLGLVELSTGADDPPPGPGRIIAETRYQGRGFVTLRFDGDPVSEEFELWADAVSEQPEGWSAPVWARLRVTEP